MELATTNSPPTPGFGKTPGALEKGVKTPPAAPTPLSLILREVELEKLHKIDVANQSFHASIWMQFVIPGGAKDAALASKSDEFPMNNGKPTFKPSALWYMKQIDLRNALSYKVIDQKVMERDDDLLMQVRLEGAFTEVYELNSYPFDTQGCSITLSVNTRSTGPMPVKIGVDERAKATMTCIQMCPPSKEWHVVPDIAIRTHVVGSGDRSFPGVTLTARLTRKPFYHLLYLTAPFAIFSLLAILTGATRAVDHLPHRAQLGLMLVLTAATYRIAIGNKLPPISYLTTLDYYTLIHALIIIIVALEARVIILVMEQHHDGPPGRLTGSSDIYVDIALAVIWIASTIWLGVKGFHRGNGENDTNLNSGDAIVVRDESYGDADAAHSPRPPHPTALML